MGTVYRNSGGRMVYRDGEPMAHIVDGKEVPLTEAEVKAWKRRFTRFRFSAMLAGYGHNESKRLAYDVAEIALVCARLRNEAP